MIPLISVVIPAYNHHNYVRRCLDSVAASTYPNKEIIIIDDGSKDSTAQEIRNWIKANEGMIPITFLSRENKGISATLNEAIKLSSGTLIAPIASDDYLLPEGLTQRATYLQDHPDMDAVFGDCQVVDGNGSVVFDRCFQSFHKTDTRLYRTARGVSWGIVIKWALAGPIAMMRRHVYDKVGGYDERRIIEDWDFFLRLAARQCLGYIDVPVAAYRVHDTNSCIGKEKQSFILKELASSGFHRAHLFSFPLNVLVVMKALFYTLKSFALRF